MNKQPISTWGVRTLMCLALLVFVVPVPAAPNGQDKPVSGNPAEVAAAKQRYDAYKAQSANVDKLQKDIDALTRSLFPSGNEQADKALWSYGQRTQYNEQLPAMKGKRDLEKAALGRLGDEWDNRYGVVLAPISKFGQTMKVTYLDKSVHPPALREKTMEYILARIEDVWGAKDESPSILPEGKFEAAIDLDGKPAIGATIRATARFSKMGKLPAGDPPLWGWKVTGDLDKVEEKGAQAQIRVRGAGLLKVQSYWIGPFGKWQTLAEAEIAIKPEADSPLLGTWEGKLAYAPNAMQIIIERRQGKDIVGLMVMGDRMPFKGVWNEAAGAWGIHLAPMPDSPMARKIIEDPGFTKGDPFTSLKLLDDGQLQLFAPPCILRKKSGK
ncbi:MAG: hypothetical protein NTZ26_15520 [Candidatus Aminicenantes bacterium]|nr:hypothetical protein [Candidatus Aminicenantes bacterium]